MKTKLLFVVACGVLGFVFRAKFFGNETSAQSQRETSARSIAGASDNEIANSAEEAQQPNEEAANEYAYETNGDTPANVDDLKNLLSKDPQAFVLETERSLSMLAESDFDARDVYVELLSEVIPTQSEKVSQILCDEIKLTSSRDKGRTRRLLELVNRSRNNDGEFIGIVTDLIASSADPRLTSTVREIFEQNFSDLQEGFESYYSANVLVLSSN